MTLDEYFSYLSEIKELEAMLKELPKDRVLARVSLEARLKVANEIIDKEQHI